MDVTTFDLEAHELRRWMGPRQASIRGCAGHLYHLIPTSAKSALVQLSTEDWQSCISKQSLPSNSIPSRYSAGRLDRRENIGSGERALSAPRSGYSPQDLLVTSAPDK